MTFRTKKTLGLLVLAMTMAPRSLPADELLPRDLRRKAALIPLPEPLPGARVPPVRLFRMPLTISGSPTGLDEDDPILDPDASLTPSPLDDFDLPHFQVAMGDDNPFFEFRRRGAPGGVGFTRLFTQVPLFDRGSTSFLLACEASTPAGLQSNGVNQGPSFVSPALTLLHDLGEGSALHGFIGTDLQLNQAWRDSVGRAFQYGIAFQQPIPGLIDESKRGLFVFVEALGRYRDRIATSPHSWEVLPGVHYRLGPAWWFSGGVVVPVGAVRDYGRGWHVTCQCQF